ncbi:hypothetical protein GCM10023084_77390 [Streptomyces lacrimifluminis]
MPRSRRFFLRRRKRVTPAALPAGTASLLLSGPLRPGRPVPPGRIRQAQASLLSLTHHELVVIAYGSGLVRPRAE